MKVLPLDRYIKEGVTYKTKEREAYIVRKIGTDSSTPAYLEIDGKKTGTIDSEVAPWHVTSSNLLGPLDLGPLYYVIPPDTEFKVVGASGCKMRLIGQKIILEPGERLGAPYADRFERQFDHYLTLISATLTLGTDEVFKANEERTILSLKPSVYEIYKFNGYIGVKGSGDTITEGDFAIVFYYNGNPLEHITTDGFGPGIDIKSMPLPPADTTEEVPYTLKDYPIEVPGPNELVIKIRNISGADKAPASGSAWSFTLKAIVEYIRK